MMFLTLIMSSLLLAVTPVHTPQGQNDAKPTKKIKIGTYDNRAIAVAYAASRHNPVKEKMAEYEKAKAAGDRKKMKELEAWGEHHQQLLHFQGFGRVPVNDLLEPVKDKVQELARNQGLAAVTQSCDYAGGEVEIVDVTEELVKLYDPTDKTITMSRNIRTAKLVDLVQLGKLPAKH